MRKFKRTGNTAIEDINVNYEKKSGAIAFFGIIILGTLIGTITFWAIPDNKILMFDIINHGFIKSYDNQTVFICFLNAFKNTAIPIFILFLLGFGAVSQPLELFFLFYRGIALGISVSYTYFYYGYKGFIVALLLILPHALLSSILLILAVRESIKSSNMIAGFTFAEKVPDKTNSHFKLYVIKFVVLLGLLVISSVIDAMLMVIFKGFL